MTSFQSIKAWPRRIGGGFWSDGRPGLLLWLAVFVLPTIFLIQGQLFEDDEQEAHLTYGLHLTSIGDDEFIDLTAIPAESLWDLQNEEELRAELVDLMVATLGRSQEWDVAFEVINTGEAAANDVRVFGKTSGKLTHQAVDGNGAICSLTEGGSEGQNLTVNCDRIVPGGTAVVRWNLSAAPLSIQEAETLAEETFMGTGNLDGALALLARAKLMQCGGALLSVSIDGFGLGLADPRSFPLLGPGTSLVRGPTGGVVVTFYRVLGVPLDEGLFGHRLEPSVTWKDGTAVFDAVSADYGNDGRSETDGIQVKSLPENLSSPFGVSLSVPASALGSGPGLCG